LQLISLEELPPTALVQLPALLKPTVIFADTSACHYSAHGPGRGVKVRLLEISETTFDLASITSLSP
jgi:hypothetical protein